MNQKIYLLVGAPGSGKTWVTGQLNDQYKVLKHDDLAYGNGQSRESYVQKAMKESAHSAKPIIIETPSSIRQIFEPLTKAGFKVEPVFILEHENVIRRRYFERENKPIPAQHISRLQTYRQRAKDMRAFSGTSTEVLNYLKRRFN